jgi:hypothetical protein
MGRKTYVNNFLGEGVAPFTVHCFLAIGAKKREKKRFFKLM